MHHFTFWTWIISRFIRTWLYKDLKIWNIVQKCQKCQICVIYENLDCLRELIFFLNYQQHKVGISGNYYFPFISTVKHLLCTFKFGGKYNLNI